MNNLGFYTLNNNSNLLNTKVMERNSENTQGKKTTAFNDYFMEQQEILREKFKNNSVIEFDINL